MKGGLDQDRAFVSQTATEEPGDVKLPPTQTLLSFSSQNTAATSPLGPPDPSAANSPEEGVYDATLFAEVLPIDEKDPAKYTVSPSAHPARMVPPELVDARRDKAPSGERERRVEVDGSNVTAAEAFWNRSRPANAPASPTLPIRSKSTRGRAPRTTLIEKKRGRRTRVGLGGCEGYIWG